MLSNKEIMAKAREALQGKWALSIGVSFIAYLLIVLFSIPSALVDTIPVPNLICKLSLLTISGAASLLLPAPLMVGLYFFFHNIAQKRNTRFSDVFCNFHYKYWRTVLVNLIFSVALIIPIAILGGISAAIFPIIMNSTVAAMILFMVVFLILSVIGIIWFALLDISYCILAVNLKLDTLGVISHAIEILKGNYKKYFGLLVRFSGWYLLCMATFGIAYIWIHSYSSTCTLILYQELEKNSSAT